MMLFTAQIAENAEKGNSAGISAPSAISAVKGFRRPHERGFALLLVFLMAALVAIALYREVPRVAFEAQRSKEELLIERGEQYKRAIQIFVRQNNNRYPQKIEDLENFNNRRYLRKRYKDPMTGKDEWRLIHIGPGGVFTDSLTQKPPQAAKGSFGTSVEDIAKEQQGEQSATGRIAPWQRQRASEGGGQYLSTQVSRPETQEEEEPPQPANTPPAPQQPQEGENVAQETGQPPVPGQAVPPGQPVPPGQFIPGQPVQPGQNPQGPTVVQAPAFPWQQQTGQQGQPAIMPGQPGWRPGIGQPGQPGQPALMPGQPGWQPVQPAPQMPPSGSEPSGATQAGQPGGPAQSPFYQPRTRPPQFNPPQYSPPTTAPPTQSPTTSPQMPGGIQQQLFNPAQRSPFGQNRNMTMGGGGIAGVASKSEDPGIKTYNDRSKYNEWEFVYDPRKDKTNPMGAYSQGVPPGPPGMNTNTRDTSNTKK